MLVDSNLCLRILHEDHPQHQTAIEAVSILTQRGEELCVVPQNLIEIWAVATRPVKATNGLGLSTQEAVEALQTIKGNFTVLADMEGLYRRWEALVIRHQVSGKATHDARIVAAMLEHGQTSILTFNTGDFTRYPGIDVVHPADVATRA